VNFLARPRGSNVAPTLFFAECVKYDGNNDIDRKTTCCTIVVPPKHVAGQLYHAAESGSYFSLFIFILLDIFYLDMLFLVQRNSGAITVSLKGLVLCIQLKGITMDVERTWRRWFLEKMYTTLTKLSTTPKR
jgi:hypothetical protein